MELHLYSQSAQVVLPQIQAAAAELLDSADLASLTVLDDDGNVVPFSYHRAVSSPGGRACVTIHKGKKKFTGQLVSQEDGNAMVYDGRTLTLIRDYDYLQTEIHAPMSAFVTIGEVCTPVTLSYRATDLFWQPIAAVRLGEQCLQLRLAALITNRTGQVLQAATSLVAGRVNQTTAAVGGSRMMALAARTTGSPSEGLEDYMVYQLGTLQLGPTMVMELDSMAAAMFKIYTYRTDELGVKYGYRFAAPKFLPAVAVDTYDSAGVFLGTSAIGEKQGGQTVDLLVGSSSKLQCESTIESSETQEGEKCFAVTEKLTVRITNYQREVGHLLIKHYVGDKRVVKTKCMKHTLREDGYIEWGFQIPAASDQPAKQTFECEIVTNRCQ